jgi:protein-S-isoprenylcysteine O-methyltransferase Ste14
MTTQAIGTTIRLLISFTAGLGLFAAIIFWPAGRFDWVAGWVYLGILIANLFVNVVYLTRVNPEVIKHRLQTGEGTKLWDKIWAVVFTPVFLGIYVTAGFDAVRFEWSVMSPWLWPLGLALFIPSTALFTWCMGVNPFFEKTVRIQTERGHRVIDTGPYGFVRHPGYLGFSGWSLSVPLFLGSWWAFLPVFLAIIGIVIRTALEDRTLLQELTGYEKYARRVRYRLIPGIW